MRIDRRRFKSGPSPAAKATPQPLRCLLRERHRRKPFGQLFGRSHCHRGTAREIIGPSIPESEVPA
jgi:hypothetical protein